MRLRAHLSGGEQGGRATIGGVGLQRGSGRAQIRFGPKIGSRSGIITSTIRSKAVHTRNARSCSQAAQTIVLNAIHHAAPASTSRRTLVFSRSRFNSLPLTARPSSYRRYVIRGKPKTSAALYWLYPCAVRHASKLWNSMGGFIVDLLSRNIVPFRNRVNPFSISAIISRLDPVWRGLPFSSRAR